MRLVSPPTPSDWQNFFHVGWQFSLKGVGHARHEIHFPDVILYLGWMFDPLGCNKYAPVFFWKGKSILRDFWRKTWEEVWVIFHPKRTKSIIIIYSKKWRLVINNVIFIIFTSVKHNTMVLFSEFLSCTVSAKDLWLKPLAPTK